ncbi:succinate dehydrogenase cytochrome B subunit [Plesiocystis pacifica SIR-1]|uniref:Succinate dehydrogenase cytochrome B subunit n=1 Tax=Plesiocystis pacifica SIR-1 TaxID=391625 RepID=A6G270_9BACT|nr:succinate dehydrogenase cytochrome b subunit [Plesiocystis pacifica]EDM80039.1 succinate dehydrogenase cytochrome B subunit [Plesiocystis pacifica SIR-1]
MSSGNAPPLDRLVKALTSTISLKIVMAVTGIAGAGFVIFHMLGNLQMFLGREAYNTYAEFMQNLGELKWVARLGLLGILFGHVSTAVLLVQRNTAARPEGYYTQKRKRTSVAAVYMAQLGIVLLLFIIYHILHFTGGMIHTDLGYELVEMGPNGARRDLYTHVINSFSNPLIALTYVAANLALALHLAHGATSMFKTIGFGVGRWKVPVEAIGPAFGVIVGLGNISMPIAVLTGVIGAN